MSKVFQVKPKRLKRSNGTVLTPDYKKACCNPNDFEFKKLD